MTTMYPLREYTAEELPDAKLAVRKGLEFASKIESSWSKSKKFDDVQTYTTWSDNFYWAARVSYHSGFTYEEMLATVLNNHTEYEAEYIGMVQGFEPLDSVPGWLSRNVHYKFPFPLKNRDMTIWLASEETTPGSEFVNVTIPRRLNTGATKAVYVSVEVVTKLSDGRIRWIMGTTSDAGGWVPQIVQRPQMSAAVAEDVPQFKTWIERWRQTH